MNIKDFGKATEEIINEFEQHIGFSLPEDYRKFLLEHNGGVLERHNLFFIENLQEHIPFEVLYGLGLQKSVDLKYWYDEYEDDLYSQSIIIGRDPGGAMVVLVTDPSREGVYYYDHAFYFKQSNEGNNSYKIADSFTSFIEGLRESDTWE